MDDTGTIIQSNSHAYELLPVMRIGPEMIIQIISPEVEASADIHLSGSHGVPMLGQVEKLDDSLIEGQAFVTL